MHQHSHHHHQHKNEGKARFVVYLTAAAMLAEIGFGYYTNSMSLLADGWHMAAHVLAIGLTWFAYSFARKHEDNPKFVNGTGKIFALAGYTSAVVLFVVAVLMISESIERLLDPHTIKFDQAIMVAFIGLAVNGISAFVLHHDKEHRDHNIHAAYLHVLADVLTSLLAIVALGAGLYWNIIWLDSISGILGSIIIGNWAIKLTFNSGKELLDYHKDPDHNH